MSSKGLKRDTAIVRAFFYGAKIMRMPLKMADSRCLARLKGNQDRCYSFELIQRYKVIAAHRHPSSKTFTHGGVKVGYF